MSKKIVGIPKSMEKEFDEDIKEILVVTSDFGAGAGTSQGSKYWTANMDILAYIEDGKLVNDKGSLVWAMTSEEADEGKYWNRFAKGCIYKIRGRHLKVKDTEKSTKWNNQWYILEVVDSNLKNPELEEILEEYRKPVIIKDDVLGELEFDKDLCNFNGVTMWGDEEIEVFIDSDEEGNVDSAVDACKKIFLQYEKWDKEARKLAADELTELANDWAYQVACDDEDDDYDSDDNDSDDEDDDYDEITESEFAERITIDSFSMESDNAFSIYFDDDDIFGGHSIIVEGTIEDGVQDAYIAG